MRPSTIAYTNQGKGHSEPKVIKNHKGLPLEQPSNHAISKVCTLNYTSSSEYDLRTQMMAEPPVHSQRTPKKGLAMAEFSSDPAD